MSEFNLNFGNGVIPVIVQDSESNQVLTLAYMNESALKKSMETGYAHYYSLSKKRIRMKGEASGNTQKIVDIYPDCENNSLLIKVEQNGDACHTGNKSCFYRKLGEQAKNAKNIDYSMEIMLELEKLIYETKENPREDSYTTYLFNSGEENIKKKVGEEAVEAILAQGKDRIIYETSDLLYHLLVFLSFEKIRIGEIMNELSKRHER